MESMADAGYRDIARNGRPAFLFCLPTTALSGGVKAVIEVANRLLEAGENVSLFSYGAQPSWCSYTVPFLPERAAQDVRFPDFDVAVIANVSMLAEVLPYLGTCRPALFAQDHEAFHYSSDGSCDGYRAPKDLFDQLYRLPVPILTQSSVVSKQLEERAGRRAVLVPIGVNTDVFQLRRGGVPTERENGRPSRVLLVGSLSEKRKGLEVGLAALRSASTIVNLRVTIACRSGSNDLDFGRYGFPVEILEDCSELEMAELYQKSDLYLCSSFYEGLGLPMLEAFATGVPVVSTRNFGVHEFGIDGYNVLLADAGDSDTLGQLAQNVLTDNPLASRLAANGLVTARRICTWGAAIRRWREVLHGIASDSISTDVRTWAGADEALINVSRQLLHELVRGGFHTPAEVLRSIDLLDLELKETIFRGEANGFDDPGVAKSLEELQNEYARASSIQSAAYYKAFRSRADFCAALLHFRELPEVRRLIQYFLQAIRV